MIKKKLVAILGLFSLIFACNNAMASDSKSSYTEDDWIKAKKICDNHITSFIMQNESTTTTSISIQFDSDVVVGEQCMTVYSHFIYEEQADKLNQIKFLNDITNQKGKN